MTKSNKSPSFGSWNRADEQDMHGPKMIKKLLANPPPVAAEWKAYQNLAKAVLVAAVKDAEKGDEDARRFLTVPNKDLAFWRAVADF